MEKKTPLYDTHIKLGGKIVPFAGFLLPIQYSDIKSEHMAVREAAGLFDVSHMGEIVITGKDALKTLNNLLPNEFKTLKKGKVRYSPLLNNNGGIIDDLLVYHISDSTYKLVVNASNIEKDVDWIKNHLIGDTKMENVSEDIGQIALQGPKSLEILREFVNEDDIPKAYYSFTKNANFNGIGCLISRTGYTGSFGYEIYLKSEDTTNVWNSLLEKGKKYGLIPCGLGARDTLRIEACMPLYGQEMTDNIDPFTAGLDFSIKMEKEENFIGKEALKNKLTPKKVRVGLKVLGRGIVRGESLVLNGEKEIGFTTSGTLMPYLNAAYAMAIIDREEAEIGNKLFVSVRGKSIEALVVPMPFYRS
ncbi:MAG: glycine cleavage system aminomethyltransferase GcvT [Defluviitaleaceae bacterium]|nr:glycine cleavage system aminomethyltransferase GcvT [Defluviitaleaceae bacterium]